MHKMVIMFCMGVSSFVLGMDERERYNLMTTLELTREQCFFLKKYQKNARAFQKIERDFKENLGLLKTIQCLSKQEQEELIGRGERLDSKYAAIMVKLVGQMVLYDEHLEVIKHIQKRRAKS